jgi:hypothetical protein
MRRVCSFLAVVAICATVAGRAGAEEEAPGDTPEFMQAMSDLDAGRHAQACPALRDMLRQDPRPKTLFYLAQCEEKWGRIATAAVHYDDYLAMYDGLSPSVQKQEQKREEQAAARREALEKKIPRVMLRLPGDAPASTRVLRTPPDGGAPVPVAVGVPLPIDPGKHVIGTEVPGRPRMDKSFTVKEGESKVVELEVAPASSSIEPTRKAAPLQPVPSLLPPLDPGTPPRRIAAYTLGGVGVVGILGGVVTGAITWAQKGPIESNCIGRICNPIGVGAKDTAKATGIISTVAFPVGLAALGAGVLLYVTEPAPARLGGMPAGPRVGTRVGLGSLTVEGAW